MNWFLLSVAAMLLQGVIVFLIKLLTNYFNPLLLLFMQYAGGLVSVAIYIKVKKLKIKISKKELRLALMSGFLVSTGLSFYYLAIKLAPVSIVTPIQSVGVMLAQLMLGLAFLKEKLTKRLIAGIACAVTCIILLTL